MNVQTNTKVTIVIIIIVNWRFSWDTLVCSWLGVIELIHVLFYALRIFPWIIDIFEISSYYFYKVIELLIRVEDGLSRDVVKHLNHASILLLLV